MLPISTKFVFFSKSIKLTSQAVAVHYNNYSTYRAESSASLLTSSQDFGSIGCKTHSSFDLQIKHIIAESSETLFVKVKLRMEKDL